MRALALAILAVCLLLLGTLGTWQASRFIERRAIFAQMEVSQALPVAELTSAQQLTEAFDYRNVRLAGGKLLMEKTALVARRFHKHLPGNWTITPYQFSDGSVVIVHTGWLPDARPTDPRTPPAELTGIVVTPTKVKTDDVARTDRAFSLDGLPFLGALDTEFLYTTLALPAPPRPNTLVVLTGDEQPNVYPAPSHAHITNPYLTPAVHFGYATLWYGAGLLMIWLFWAGWTGRLDPSAR